MFLWGTYQIINVVIIMNLLIALMNSTIAAIQDDKITEWRFARTQVHFFANLSSSWQFHLKLS